MPKLDLPDSKNLLEFNLGKENCKLEIFVEIYKPLVAEHPEPSVSAELYVKKKDGSFLTTAILSNKRGEAQSAKFQIPGGAKLYAARCGTDKARDCKDKDPKSDVDRIRFEYSVIRIEE